MGRIRLEVTAVQEIIRRCTTGELTMVSSEAIAEEISKIPDQKKQVRVEKIASVAKEYIVINEAIITRMHELIRMGGMAMDALHIACAERAGAVFLTMDDDLITFFKLHKNIQVLIENPVTWLKEEHK